MFDDRCAYVQDAWEGLGTDLRGTVARQVASEAQRVSCVSRQQGVDRTYRS